MLRTMNKIIAEMQWGVCSCTMALLGCSRGGLCGEGGRQMVVLRHLGSSSHVNTVCRCSGSEWSKQADVVGIGQGQH